MNKKIYPTLKLSVLSLLVSLLMTPAFAAVPTGSPNDFAVSLGNLCEFVGKIQTDSSGKKNTCSFLPSLAANYDFFLSNNFAISPQLGATLPKSGRDENIKRMTMFALLNGKYKTPSVNFTGGVGFYFTRISGPGGEEPLNNGNGTDSFPLPAEAVYSRNFIVNLGIGTSFSAQWSADLYTYVFNALKSEDRAFSVGASVSYHFGDLL